MEVEAILGFVLLVCFVLALFIVLTARIASARRNRAKRKEKAEELTRIYVNTAIQRLKISGLERRTRWLDEDSNSMAAIVPFLCPCLWSSILVISKLRFTFVTDK